jgi:hypothetical protein
MTQSSEHAANAILVEKCPDDTLPDSNLTSLNESYEPGTLSTVTKITHAVLSALFISYAVAICLLRNSGWHVALIVVALAQIRIIAYHISFGAGLFVLWSRLYTVRKALHIAVPVWIRPVVGYVVPLVLLLIYVVLKGDTEHGTRVERLISLGGMCVLVGILTLFSKVNLLTHTAFSIILIDGVLGGGTLERIERKSSGTA